MATTRRGYLFATFLFSCAALVLLIVSCAANFWLTTDLVPLKGQDIEGSRVNFGLFSGTFTKQTTPINAFIIDVKIVCDFGENICAWSCMTEADQRSAELASLYLFRQHSLICPYTMQNVNAPLSSADTPGPVANPDAITPRVEFLNAGLWLSTLVFLLLAIVATAVAALLAVVNTAANPTSSWMAGPGLYGSNGVAALMDLLTLVMWGSHYGDRLAYSIGLNEVISGEYSSRRAASLGWCYWLVLVPLVMSAANVGLLWWRDRLIKREPPPVKYNPERENADGTLFLY